jgi:hypothetical protein
MTSTPTRHLRESYARICNAFSFPVAGRVVAHDMERHWECASAVYHATFSRKREKGKPVSIPARSLKCDRPPREGEGGKFTNLIGAQALIQSSKFPTEVAPR